MPICAASPRQLRRAVDPPDLRRAGTRRPPATVPSAPRPAASFAPMRQPLRLPATPVTSSLSLLPHIESRPGRVLPGSRMLGSPNRRRLDGSTKNAPSGIDAPSTASPNKERVVPTGEIARTPTGFTPHYGSAHRRGTICRANTSPSRIPAPLYASTSNRCWLRNFARARSMNDAGSAPNLGFCFSFLGLNIELKYCVNPDRSVAEELSCSAIF